MPRLLFVEGKAWGGAGADCWGVGVGVGGTVDGEGAAGSTGAGVGKLFSTTTGLTSGLATTGFAGADGIMVEKVVGVTTETGSETTAAEVTTVTGRGLGSMTGDKVEVVVEESEVVDDVKVEVGVAGGGTRPSVTVTVTMSITTSVTTSKYRFWCRCRWELKAEAWSRRTNAARAIEDLYSMVMRAAAYLHETNGARMTVAFGPSRFARHYQAGSFKTVEDSCTNVVEES